MPLAWSNRPTYFSMSPLVSATVQPVSAAGQEVDPERLVMDRIIMEKAGLICSNPLIWQELKHGKSWALQELWEKGIKSHPANF